MNKAILTSAAIGMSVFVNAASAMALAAVQGKAQLVVAVQDNSGVNFGSDAATTSHPNAGMNTMPTKDVGTESNAVNPNAPASKPGQSPDFSPPPTFATPPAYTPPSTQNGTTNTPSKQ
jgi:hypothetical protein